MRTFPLNRAPAAIAIPIQLYSLCVCKTAAAKELMKQTFPAIAIPVVYSHCTIHSAGFLPTMVLYTGAPILPYMAVYRLTY